MKRGASKLSVTRPVSLRIGLFVLLVSFFWSGNIVAIKFGLSTIPPFWSAFWRMGVAVVVVACWRGFALNRFAWAGNITGRCWG